MKLRFHSVAQFEEGGAVRLPGVGVVLVAGGDLETKVFG